MTATLTDTAWQLLATVGPFEYWRRGDDVFRRKVSVWNVIAPDGSPMGARWEGSFDWYQRFVAGNA